MKIIAGKDEWDTKYEPGQTVYFMDYTEDVVGNKKYVVNNAQIMSIIVNIGYHWKGDYKYDIQGYRSGDSTVREDGLYETYAEVQKLCDAKNGETLTHKNYMNDPAVRAKFDALRKDYEAKYKELCDGWKNG